MLDFNHRPTLPETITGLIDKGIYQQHQKQEKRHYLGASLLGENCKRKIQYHYFQITPDKDIEAKILRIFQAGHVFEDLAIKWLKDVGFDLYTLKPDGSQFGFSVASGRIQGHVDGIINHAPDELGFHFPMLWECKSLNNKSWKDTVNKGLEKSKPIYAAQIALYQAYMEETIVGISSNPCLFTTINKDTAELYFELIPFNAELAQKTSDKAVNILKSCEAGEILPRITNDINHFECKFCSYHQTCWKGE